MNNHQHFGINDLAESVEIERFYGIVRELTGIAIAICHTDGNVAKLLCPEQNFNPICREILSSPQGREKCYATNRLYCGRAAKAQKGLRYYCHAGLVDMAVPIYIDGAHIATINAGQMLTEKTSKKGFDNLLQKLDGIPCDINKLQNAYERTTYTPIDKLERIFELLSFFAEYFCEVGQRLKSSSGNPKYPQIASAQKFIKENYDKTISLSDVAQHVHLSENYLSRLFRKATGTTFVNYLNSIRINQAKKLLLSTDRHVTKIAFEIGFNNLPHFNRTFRALQKCSPSDFRKNNKPEN